MRVFHGPANVAGAAGVLSAAQQSLGVEAKSVCFDTGHYKYVADEILPLGIKSEIRLLTMARHFDVFHFYFGQSLTMSKLWDIPLLKRLGKKVFLYFCGCDIRDSKLVIERHPISACAECWPMSCSPNRSAALEAAAVADGVFVSTPDLLEFVPDAILLPQPIDLEKMAKLNQLSDLSSPDSDAPVRIVHAPSDRSIKGTVHVERSVEELAASGHDVELVLVEGMSYVESLEVYRTSDLAVDQLLIGAYGQFAVELMAMGKPVVCYVRDDLRPHYGDQLPIVSAEPSTLTDVLAKLISDRSQFARIGREGMDYVASRHGADVVAARALDCYRGARP